MKCISRDYILYFLFLFLFTLGSFEIILRWRKIGQTWSEKIGHGYVSGFNWKKSSWLYTNPPDSTIEINNSDFKYLQKTNSLGLRERETPFSDSSGVRIICIGDSYTEGLGAPYDSTYPRFLERRLNENGSRYQVYNAGVAASDPFYAAMLLKQKLLLFKPECVLMTVNSSDLTDYVFRGGNERFKANGTTQFNKGPWFEKLYQKSYTLRYILRNFFDYNDNLFVRKKDIPLRYSEAISAYVKLADAMNDSLTEKGIKLLVIIQPIASEIAYKIEDNTNIHNAFDLLQTELNKKNILSIDMRVSLEGKITSDNINQYAYPNDAHYNSLGYQLFSDNLIAEILLRYPNFFDSSIN